MIRTPRWLRQLLVDVWLNGAAGKPSVSDPRGMMSMARLGYTGPEPRHGYRPASAPHDIDRTPMILRVNRSAERRLLCNSGTPHFSSFSRSSCLWGFSSTGVDDADVAAEDLP